jgi:hypothetical protein
VIPPAGECVWGCESGQPFNCEHIIGRQFAKAIGMPFPVPISWGEIERATGRDIEHGSAVEDELAICTDDRVCERCNRRWMKKLDDRAVKALRPALRANERVYLDQKQQLTVSRWAVKVGLLLALWFHDQPTDPQSKRKGPVYVPADNFHRLYANSTSVPENTCVWLGAIDPGIPISECFIAAEGVNSRASGEPAGYYSIFRLRRVIFFVCGFSLQYKVPPAESINPLACMRDPRAMRRLWPPREAIVEWPPPTYLQADDHARLVQGQPYGR